MPIRIYPVLKYDTGNLCGEIGEQAVDLMQRALGALALGDVTDDRLKTGRAAYLDSAQRDLDIEGRSVGAQGLPLE